MRVLVVDDDPTLRDALRRALTLDGYDVDLAVDGADALRTLAYGSPDAIILDVLLPNVDGLETCRRLRASDDDTPVLMLTVREGVQDIVAGLDAGADDYPDEALRAGGAPGAPAGPVATHRRRRGARPALRRPGG